MFQRVDMKSTFPLHPEVKQRLGYRKGSFPSVLQEPREQSFTTIPLKSKDKLNSFCIQNSR